MEIQPYYLQGLPYPKNEFPDGAAIESDYLLIEAQAEEDALVKRFLNSNHVRASSAS